MYIYKSFLERKLFFFFLNFMIETLLYFRYEKLNADIIAWENKKKEKVKLELEKKKVSNLLL